MPHLLRYRDIKYISSFPRIWSTRDLNDYDRERNGFARDRWPWWHHGILYQRYIYLVEYILIYKKLKISLFLSVIIIFEEIELSAFYFWYFKYLTNNYIK